MPNKSRRKQPRRNTGGYNAKLVEDLCSVSDPFCEHAYGAKAPDPTRAPTVGYTLKAAGTLVTSASAPIDYFFVRASRSSLNYIEIGTGLDTDFPATSSLTESVGSHPDFIEKTRVVSAGVRLWPVYAMTAVQGLLSVIPINDDKALFDNAVHTLSDLQSTQGSSIGPMKEMQFNLSPLENEASFFQSTSTSGSVAAIEQDWSSVLIALTGTASTEFMAYEIVIHYEGIVSSTSGSSLGAMSPNSTNSKLVREYMYNMASKWGGLIYGQRQNAVKVLIGAAKAAASSPTFRRAIANKAAPLLLTM